MRSVILLCFLSGCAAASGSPARDACKTVPGEKVAEAVGAKLVKQELDGKVANGKVVNSVCNYEFDNGDWVRVSLSAYSDADYGKGFQGSFGRLPVDRELGKELGYIIYHDDGDKELFGVKAPEKQFNLRIGHDAGKIEVDKVVASGSAAVMTFKSYKVENVDMKLRKIARIAAF